MPLHPGTRLGPYEILSALGAGGMGEVYRARDSKLNRDVALKVIPDTFALDAERVARFKREAQVLASLNHPHIAAIYGFEDSGETHALVLELVEGDTLDERIRRPEGLRLPGDGSGRPSGLPVDEALTIARQIAEALEAAHEQGIIHRDLKPANIKVTPAGKVKVLDFGLAKMLESEPRASSLSMSPTLGVQATFAGVILGTAAYMSPEQARGRPVDARADIWAFGCVLFEMLAGRAAFGGESLTDVLAGVIERAPDWSALPAATPVHVKRVLRRCLEKDPARRMHHVADVRIELGEPDDTSPAVVTAGPRPAWWRALPWVGTALAVAAAVVIATRPVPGDGGREVIHLELSSPPGVEVQAGFAQSFELSPDGRRLAFVGVRDGVRHIHVRGVTQPEMREIPGTAGANSVAFSPDGEELAFVAGNATLTTFALSDSATKSLATGADVATGVAWGPMGIAYSGDNGLWFVSPAGGAARRLTTIDDSRGETEHSNPVWLPGTDVLLFSGLTNQSGTERVEAVSVNGAPRRSIVMEGARRAAWSPTGHLLFDRNGALIAVPFDTGTLKATGAAATVIPAGQVAASTIGGLSLQVTAGGALLYVPAAHGARSLVMVNRDGSSVPVDVASGHYTNPRLSPDGRRLAADENLTSEVVIDLIRGTKVPLQSPGLGTGWITWNSDGSRLAFRRFSQPFSMAADGRGDGAPIPYSTASDYPASAGPDPDSILMVRISTETSGDVYLFSMSGAMAPRPLLQGRGYQGGPQLSPDQRWLLYQSDESGQPEIYVRAYPALDRAWQVSDGGGVQARWSRGGREIAYRAGSPMKAVTFDGAAASPVLGKPVTLFDQLFDYGIGISIANYDVGSDGRFVMLRPEPSVPPFHVVLNWTEELKRLMLAAR